MLHRKANNRREHKENNTQRAAKKMQSCILSGSLRKISANSAVKMRLRNISCYSLVIDLA